MTIQEFDQKINDLKKVRSNASGLKKAELTSVIDNLETRRTAQLTSVISSAEFNFTRQDIDELKSISNTFEDATEELNNANELIDNAISLGKKLLTLL